MGGTDPTNFLNAVGKNPDGSGNGDILLWKRKAERYLVDSDLYYTIIHPGGLIDSYKEDENKLQYVLDVDDKLMSRKKKSISRTDVAKLCVAALSVCKNQKVSFDCIRTLPIEKSDNDNEDDGSGESTTTITGQTAEEVLTKFVKESKTEYNYAL